MLQEASAKYWPDNEGTLNIGPFVIETTNEFKEDTFCVRRVMKVTHSKVSDYSDIIVVCSLLQICKS